MKNLFLTAICLMTGLSIFAFSISPSLESRAGKKTTVVKSAKKVAKSSKYVITKKTPQKPLCRICCTVSVADPFGGMVGITACAGWLLTSCETAGERACEKAMSNALEALLDSN